MLLAGLAPLPAEFDHLITGLSSDSRRIQPGDLFLAVRGLRCHGLEFLPTVRQAGAAAVAWEPPYEGALEAPAELPLLAVENLRRNLGHIAGRFYGEPSRYLDLVGITGTNGKTSCAHFIAQVLDSGNCGVIGTLGHGVPGRLTAGSHTTPEALNLQRQLAKFRAQGMRFVAMEVSSHALEQGRVVGLHFTVAVLTNLTRDHLDYHGDMASYAAAKQRLFLNHHPRRVVLNLDDPFGRELALSLGGKASRVGYGLGKRPVQGMDAWVWGEALELSPAGLCLRVASSWGRGVLRSRLLGRFNASNLLAALGTLLVLKVPFREALEGLSRVSTVPGRMERFAGSAGRPLVVVDYAHTPHAMEQVLTALSEHTRGRLWCVFGCGGDRDRGKRPLMGACARRYADRVIVTDDNPRTEDPEHIVSEILAGIQDLRGIAVLRDRGQAIDHALSEAGEGDVVAILGKGHEDYQVLGSQTVPFSDREVVRRWFGE
jgi:UDP-N-acetylmuramoyl-L-alanyl-D-glutamate--2,6-diaminopimelate ligase